MSVHYLEDLTVGRKFTSRTWKITAEQIKAFVKKIADKGMKITAHGVNRFTKDHDANRKIFEFCKRLNCRSLT